MPGLARRLLLEVLALAKEKQLRLIGGASRLQISFLFLLCQSSFF